MRKIEVTVSMVKQECNCDESECRELENNLFIGVEMFSCETQKHDDKDQDFHEHQISSIIHDKVFELISHVGDEITKTINEEKLEKEKEVKDE